MVGLEKNIWKIDVFNFNDFSWFDTIDKNKRHVFFFYNNLI